MRQKGWIGCVLACWMLLALPSSALGDGQSIPEARPGLRALLIGCDHFLSQEDTWPAADNNLRMMGDTLLTDQRRYSLIRSYSDSISSVSAFEEAVQNAFGSAGPYDISLLYISTHGIYDDGLSTARAGLLLSDGTAEALLDTASLQRIMDKVPGYKVMILDACNAGAMIGKGLADLEARAFFTGPQYKVLCSAGGSEASWYYHSAQNAALVGASYFATALTYGLGYQGHFAADRNQDGDITLNELYAYLYENYAASTPQVYPQRDDFVFFSYDPQRIRPITQAITDITFEDTLLTAGQSEVAFSFTVQRQVELYYQVVYHQEGAWQFRQSQHYLDGEQLDGTVLPGRKERALSLDTGDDDAFGYAMIQLITLEEGRPVFQGARLLCIRPAQGQAALSVETGPRFAPAAGQELPILIQHDVPCGLTVSVLDADGWVVRRLAYDSPSRPQQISSGASSMYWDGRTNSGELAPVGRYAVQVRVQIGEETYTARSPEFELTAEAAVSVPPPLLPAVSSRPDKRLTLWLP